MIDLEKTGIILEVFTDFDFLRVNENKKISRGRTRILRD